MRLEKLMGHGNCGCSRRGFLRGALALGAVSRTGTAALADTCLPFDKERQAATGGTHRRDDSQHPLDSEGRDVHLGAKAEDAHAEREVERAGPGSESARSPDPENDTEMSPPCENVLPTSVRVRAGTSAEVLSSDAAAPPSHGMSRSAGDS